MTGALLDLLQIANVLRKLNLDLSWIITFKMTSFGKNPKI